MTARPVERAALLILALALPACRGGGHSLLCPHVTATLTLDWTGMLESGKTEARIRSDMAEASAMVSEVGAVGPHPTIDGAARCEAADVVAAGDAYYGYVSVCRYCLPTGSYELVTKDAWGDGWGDGVFHLALEGCDALEGTQAKGPKQCSPRNGHESCNATSRVAFEAHHHPSPAPTFRRDTFEFTAFLDFTGATADRFADARVAVRSFSRGYGARTASGLLAPKRLYDPRPADGSSDRSRAPGDAVADLPCDVEAWWGFDAVLDSAAAASPALAADYALPPGDYALLVAGGDWGGGNAHLADAAGYAVYAAGAPAGGFAAFNFTVSHDYPTASPTWAPGPVHLDLHLNWTRSYELAIVEVYRVDGLSMAAPAPTSARPSPRPSPAPSRFPTARPSPAPTTSSPTTWAPTTRAPSPAPTNYSSGAPTAANATRAPSARPPPAPTSGAPSPLPSAAPSSSTPTPRPTHHRRATAPPTAAATVAPSPKPTKLSSALAPDAWLTPLATATYYDVVEGHPLDDEYSLQPRAGFAETFRYDVHAYDVLLLRLYCWAAGWKGGRVTLTRSADAHVLVDSTAEGCGTPAHPTFVDVLVDSGDLAVPSAAPSPAPTSEPSPEPSYAPSAAPSPEPSAAPAPRPTRRPTAKPTRGATDAPSAAPSARPNNVSL